MIFKYQLGIAGKAWFDIFDFKNLIAENFAILGLGGHEFEIFDENEIETRDQRSPFCLIFFGYDGATGDDHPVLKQCIQDSVPIIPAVDLLTSYIAKVPKELTAINGIEIGPSDDVDLPKLVSCVFENLSLLRTDRRVFISYRRKESREVALQLYDALQSRNFDTFLDTHSIRAGVPMQDHLWHRLADSDVVILLDSPEFRTSQWTWEEQRQANATSIQILHVLWPTVQPDPYSALSHFHALTDKDFATDETIGDEARLRQNAISNLCTEVESLRARALGARHSLLVDQFCDLCRDRGLSAVLHPQRFIVAKGNDGIANIFFPAVGVPNAYRINQIEEIVKKYAVADKKICVLYDNRGLLTGWLAHLGWLNGHLKIQAVAVTNLDEISIWGK